MGRIQPEASLPAVYLRTLSRWWVVVLGCAIVGALLSFILTLRTLPIYEALTSLDIQSFNSDFLNMRNVDPTSDNSSSSTEYYVQTQIKLLQSATVLNRTVERLKAEPHPEAIDRNDLISVLKRSLHLSHGRDLAYTALVDDAARRVKVKPQGVTRLVEVTCDSWDAEFSAKFCNTLTEQYKAIDLETRELEARKTSEFLTRQVADIRQKAEQAQQQLEAATGGDGLALSQEGNNIGEDRLRQLQGELVRAQAERIGRESELRIAMTAAPNSIPAALDSPVYREDQQRLADLKSKVAELVPPLTEDHPKVIHLRSQIHDVEQDMAAVRAATLARLQNDYETSRRHEDLLNGTYASLMSNVSEEMSKTERVNLLRREVDSEQQLYQTLLQRAKEAGFASAMQTTTIRVVDAAAAKKTPISPRRGTAAVAGLLLGMFSGLGFSFFRDRMTNVFHTPGESEAHLYVPELGVVPSHSIARSRPMRPMLQIKAGSGSLLKLESLPPALFCWSETFSIVAEAYRNLAHSIFLAGTGKRSRVYIITSPNANEGKTTVTAHLGVAMSKTKLRVVIVDGDLRNPSLHKTLQLENSCGMRNILRQEIDVETAPLESFCKPTAVPNLSLVSAGTGHEDVVELLHSGAITGLLNRLVSEFNVVLIDTPPMFHMADARILAAQADGVILVFRAGSTERDRAAAACDLFEKDQRPLVGTILNDFNPVREGRQRYYHTYYQYKQHMEAEEKSGVAL